MTAWSRACRRAEPRAPSPREGRAHGGGPAAPRVLRVCALTPARRLEGGKAAAARPGPSRLRGRRGFEGRRGTPGSEKRRLPPVGREAGPRSGGSRWAPSALLLEGPSPRAPCGQGRLRLAAARRDSTTLALTARTEARREARLREVRGHPRGVAHRGVSRARMPVLVRSAPRPTSPSGHFLPFAPCSDAARGRPGSAAGQTPPCILGKGPLPRSAVRATVTHWSQAGP